MAGHSVIKLALLICPQWIRRNSSASHTSLQLNRHHMSETRGDCRLDTEPFGPGVSVICTAARLSTSNSIIPPPVWGWNWRTIRLKPANSSISLPPLIKPSSPWCSTFKWDREHTTGSWNMPSKAFKDYKILATTVGYKWYETENTARLADLTLIHSGE